MELDISKVFHHSTDIENTKKYIGWKGYFADNVVSLCDKVRQGIVTELKTLQYRGTYYCYYGYPYYDGERFWGYFYPVEPHSINREEEMNISKLLKYPNLLSMELEKGVSIKTVYKIYTTPEDGGDFMV